MLHILLYLFSNKCHSNLLSLLLYNLSTAAASGFNQAQAGIVGGVKAGAKGAVQSVYTYNPKVLSLAVIITIIYLDINYHFTPII